MKKILLYQTGFTLMELLITISIMVLLLAIVIPSYNQYGKENELTQVAQTIKTAILTTKNYALSPPTSKTKDIGFYKIVFESNPDAKYSIYEDGPGASTIPLDSATFKNYTLGFDPSSIASITFSIVDKGKITLPQIPGSTGIITLTNGKMSYNNQKNIKVNTVTGQVEVQQ